MSAPKSAAAKRAAGKPTARKRTTGAKPSGLRDALKAKQIRTGHYEIPVVDYDSAVAAAKRVTETRNQLALAQLTGQADAIKAGEKLVAEAEAANAKCWHRLDLRPVSDAVQEELKREHPSDAETPLFEDPYAYALLAASADADLTAEEWHDTLSDRERWTEPDVVELLGLVIELCNRPFSAGIPKG